MSCIYVKTLCIILSLLIFSYCSKGDTPEKEALSLVLESHALGGDQSVDDTIKRMINERGDYINPLGWDVSIIKGQVYLVAYRYNVYSFEEGSGELGFFFEVDLGTGSVRDVTEEYTVNRSNLSEPFKDEREILDELFKAPYTGLDG